MNFLKNDSGASLVEYGLLVALIAVTAIVAVTRLGDNVSDLFNKVSDVIGSEAANITVN